MKTLHIISTLNPAYGGPVSGLLQMAVGLQSLGHPAEIVTLDAPTAPWLAGAPVSVHPLGPAHLGLYSFAPHLLPWLRQNAKHYEAILVHGIWQYHSLATLLSGAPYHLFVHGALDPWFRYAYPRKHIKKWLYWLPVEYHVLKHARSVLFTSKEEKRLARQSFELYAAREKVVHFGISAPSPDSAAQHDAFIQAFPTLAGRRIILYLGRLDHKKGCDLLVQAFSNLSAAHPEWTLVMAGPDPANLRPALEKLASGAPIHYTGLLTSDIKWGALRAAQIFALPSHSENFGVAVAEALACGKPVLISDKVNIWKEIEQSGAGLVEADTREGTTNLLKRYFSLGEQGQAQLAARAIPCFQQYFELSHSLHALLNHLGVPD